MRACKIEIYENMQETCKHYKNMQKSKYPSMPKSKLWKHARRHIVQACITAYYEIMVRMDAWQILKCNFLHELVCN